MSITASTAVDGFWRRALAWRRLRGVLIASILIGLILNASTSTAPGLVLLRTAIVGLSLSFVFSWLEGWPRRLPRWLKRWALQVIAVFLAVPIASLLAYAIAAGSDPPLSAGGAPPLGYSRLAMTGVLFAPWIVVAAIVGQREAAAREQAHAFALERSELERQALDARLRLLHAQVAPHFLFNTLANVQALVNAGSPRATQVLDSLIAYLRAAVPRLDVKVTTVRDEMTLVRAYLDVMQLRMPDRLQTQLHLDPQAEFLECPPMSLLTLVENAVRHGIDPSETGGRIDVWVERRGARCFAQVRDTGVGLGASSGGLGTGLVSLRERLRLSFGGDAEVRLYAAQVGGVTAELDFPARGGLP